MAPTVRQKLEQALESYARDKPNADAIATMALENYVEMMRSTGDPVFRREGHRGGAGTGCGVGRVLSQSLCDGLLWWGSTGAPLVI